MIPPIPPEIKPINTICGWCTWSINTSGVLCLSDSGNNIVAHVYTDLDGMHCIDVWPVYDADHFDPWFEDTAVEGRTEHASNPKEAFDFVVTALMPHGSLDPFWYLAYEESKCAG